MCKDSIDYPGNKLDYYAGESRWSDKASLAPIPVKSPVQRRCYFDDLKALARLPAKGVEVEENPKTQHVESRRCREDPPPQRGQCLPLQCLPLALILTHLLSFEFFYFRIVRDLVDLLMILADERICTPDGKKHGNCHDSDRHRPKDGRKTFPH